jgi:hypothetical protein
MWASTELHGAVTQNTQFTCCSTWPSNLVLLLKRFCQVTAVQTGDSPTAVAMERLCRHVVSPATTEHPIMEEAFPVRLDPELYNEDWHL